MRVRFSTKNNKKKKLASKEVSSAVPRKKKNIKITKKKSAVKRTSVKRIHAQGKVIVQCMYPDKTQKVSEQNIRVTPFISEPAKVGVSYGVTLNMTNYQSARATVWCELPCYPEEKEAALQVAQSIVAREIGREIKSLDDQRKKHGWVSAVIKPDDDLINFLRDGVHYQ
jgi:hypothetical protein